MNSFPNLSRTRVCLVLIALNVLVFGQVVTFDFVNIDDPVFFQNFYVQQGLTVDGIVWVFTHFDQNYAGMLNWISYMVDFSLYGLSPAGFHATNLLLHLINTTLFFLWLDGATGARVKSALATLVFALHPLRVETVAWISDRKDLLCMLFVLLSLELYRRYVDKGQRRFFAVACLMFLLALMSKPIIVTLPFAFLLLDFWPLKRYEGVQQSWSAYFRRLGSLVLEKIPLFVLSGFFSWLAYHAMGLQNFVVQRSEYLLGERLANIPVVYLKYLGKIIWPFGLTVYYPMVQEPSPLWQTLVAVGFLLAVTLWAVKECKRFPYLSVGWFWFLGTLVPVIGIVKVGWIEMADRYTYFPLMGLILMSVWGMAEWVHRKNWPPKVVAVFAAGVLVCMTTVSWQQTRVWQNSITLFQHALQHTENNYVAHNNLGRALMGDKRFEDAIPQFQKAIAIYPHKLFAQINLAISYKRLKHYPQAITAYEKLLERDPENVVVHYELGKLYHQAGEGEKAVRHSLFAEKRLLQLHGPQHRKTIEVRENLRQYFEAYSLNPEDFKDPENPS